MREKKILTYIKSRAHLRAGDTKLNQLLDMMTGFLTTINGLRSDLQKAKENLAQTNELYKAKCTAYDSCCTDRRNLVDELQEFKKGAE